MSHAGVAREAAKTAEIAEQLGLPTGTGESQAHHGRRPVRPLLRGDG